MPDDPQPDSDDQGRDETPTERLDRNWADLLQELRVVQTGVQFLTGFLLTLPFQQRFAELTHGEKALYLITAAAAITATAFLQAPVVVHRALFRRHQRAETVLLAHRLSMAGMLFLGIAITGVSWLITAVLSDVRTGAAAASGVVILLVAMWIVLPLHARRASRDSKDGS